MMDAYNTTLSYYGELSSRQNLGLNVVLWMSLIRFYSTADPLTSNFSSTGRGNLQYVELTGDPAVVFKSRFTGVAMSSVSGYCDINAAVNFDQANALFEASIATTAYNNDPICESVVSPLVFSEAKVDNPYFSIELDTRSLAIAVATNLGYVDIDNLLIASSSTFPISVRATSTVNVTYLVGEYFDVRYPFMKPIFCLRNITAIPDNLPRVLVLCLVSSGTALFLPVINHLGRSKKQPDYCDCQAGNGRDAQCNQLYLMAGLIVFPTNISSPFDASVIKQNVRDAYTLVAKHRTYEALNRASFDASSASVLVSTGTADTSIVNAAYMKNAFQFCKMPNGKFCSMIAFYTLGLSVAVSKYHYPVVNGSCQNVMTIENEHWGKLALTPPTELTQIYYSCLPSKYDVLIDAIGIASGNTSIAILVLLFICFPIVIVVMACCRVYPRGLEYNEKEKNRVLDTLATLILRVRDDHYEGVTKNGTISEVAEEMVKAVAYSNNRLISESAKEDDENDFDNNFSTKSNGLRRAHSVTLTEDDIEEHKGYLGRVYLYRHQRPNRVGIDGGSSPSKRPSPCKTASTRDLGGVSMKSTTHHDQYGRIEEGASPVSPDVERPTLRKLLFLDFFLLSP
jgi:hypothetical protein